MRIKAVLFGAYVVGFGLSAKSKTESDPNKTDRFQRHFAEAKKKNIRTGQLRSAMRRCATTIVAAPPHRESLFQHCSHLYSGWIELHWAH